MVDTGRRVKKIKGGTKKKGVVEGGKYVMVG